MEGKNKKLGIENTYCYRILQKNDLYEEEKQKIYKRLNKVRKYYKKKCFNKSITQLNIISSYIEELGNYIKYYGDPSLSYLFNETRKICDNICSVSSDSCLDTNNYSDIDNTIFNILYNLMYIITNVYMFENNKSWDGENTKEKSDDFNFSTDKIKLDTVLKYYELYYHFKECKEKIDKKLRINYNNKEKLIAIVNPNNASLSEKNKYSENKSYKKLKASYKLYKPDTSSTKRYFTYSDIHFLKIIKQHKYFECMLRATYIRWKEIINYGRY